MSMHGWSRLVGRAGVALLLLALLVPIWSGGSVRAATIVVSNTTDGGAGSLRDALNQVNAGAGGNTITFSIPGGGVQRIAPAGSLPFVGKPVIIDATTQPGYAGSPLIELFGGNAGGTSSAFTVIASNTTIKGFVLDGWYTNAGTGINIVSSRNTIQGNYIGTDPSGTVSVANGTGINLGPLNNTSSASNNLIGGTTALARNIISGNNGDGIAINGNNGGAASNNVIEGNYIGLNAADTALVKNPTIVRSNKTGVDIAGASNNIVGGAILGSRNVVAGNRVDNADKGSGILIDGQRGIATGNVIQGNYVGTDATGSYAIVNNAGVYIDTAKDNIVGGTIPAARNVISGSNTIGVAIDGSFDNAADGTSATGNVIEGNFIGTNASGTAAIGNNAGASITAANNNTIGGTTPGAGNLISGNGNSGIVIESPRDTTGTNGTARANVIQGNLIGTTVAGNAPLGNATGVAINGGAFNTVGGTTAAARNVISGFTGAGVLISSNANLPGSNATGNMVQGNFIGTDVSGVNNLNNGQGSGVAFDTANNNSVGGTIAGAGNTIAYTTRGVLVATASGDSIKGNAIFANGFRSIDLQNGSGNNNQAAPALTGAASSGPNQITVSGSLNSTGVAPFHIEFFSTPTATSQGKVFLSAISSNVGAFNAPITGTSAGQYITATATDANGNTSPFSNPVNIPVGPPANVTPNPGTTPQSVVAGNAFNPLTVTVRDANGNAVGAGVLVTFTAPTVGASGKFSNGGTTIQVQTDANGMASAPFTSNLVGGTYRVTASVPGASSAIFVLTNAPRPAPPPRPSALQPGTPNVEPPSRGGLSVEGHPAPAPAGR